MRELICIVCPRGCHLQASEDSNGKITKVSGNACFRGADYAVSELTHPVRILTSVVRLIGSELKRLPVKSDRPLPKEMIFPVIREIKKVTVKSPVKSGDIVIEDVLGSGVNIIATRTAEKIT